MEDRKTYLKEEAINASIKYFDGDVMAAENWVNKYALKDKEGKIYELTPDDMHRRLAKEFCRIEKKYKNPLSEEEIFNLIKNFAYIVPQGSPMAGIGNDYQIMSISNCFVIGNEEDSDSYGGILNLDQELVQLQKRRAGVGLDLSFVRPKDSIVLNSALTSTGVVPFMERFSNSTREVAQGGRRGALMESISIIHPDSENFIDAKMQDGKVTGANVSVKLTDEFMDAALNNQMFKQQYPINSKNPKFSKQISAQSLWKKIIHNAWKSAEPGVLFWDTIIRESVPDCYSDLGYKTASTNPCITIDSWVLTVNGPFQVKDLIGKQFEVYVDGKLYKSTENGFFKTGENKKVFQIETNKGLKVKTTDNHQFKKIDSEKMEQKQFSWVELKDLKENDILNIGCHKGISWNGDGDFEKGWIIGDLLGDETFKIEDETLKNNTAIISSKLESTSSDFYRGFLSSWFDVNGTIFNDTEKEICIKLSSSVLENLEIAQKMLLRLGIFAIIYKNKKIKQYEEIPESKEELIQHELVISKNNILEFAERIGFVNEEKNKKLDLALENVKKELCQENFTDKVKSITFAGFEDVYDCQIPGINEFDINGISVHNCGEIPLCPADSCRLLSLNLYSYVENPFTDKAKFNFDLFKNHVFKAQRMMDDIVDLEIEKIDNILNKIEKDPESEEIKRVEKNLWIKIKDKAIKGRRCGLGITAEGDMLAALGIIYGTDEANNFAELVQKTLKIEAYRSSVNLAKERGAFEIWDIKREENNPFIQRIKEEDSSLYEEMSKYGRRNIALLTIAPAGTTSIMTQTSSGIEPAFLLFYKRRRKINPQEKDVKVDYIDKQGDSWQEYIVIHHKFEKWLEIKGYDINEVKKMSEDEINLIIEKSPYYKATSADVNWLKKVEMQGKIQKHVDHSISVTVNLPKDVSEEMVAKVYETGWKVGCKGITVYREGSRSGVLVSNKEEKNKESFENNARRRPKVINADVWTFNNNYEKWVAIVGKLAPEGVEQIPENELPYELFTGRLESFPIPAYVEKGQVIKRKFKNEKNEDISIYDFRYIDKDGYPVEMSGLSRSFREEFWNYAKLISAILRHRMPMQYVINLVSGLKLQGDSLNTWKNGVERILRKYVKDGTKSKDTCEVCGAKLTFVEGCLKCNSCGYSKCG